MRILMLSIDPSLVKRRDGKKQELGDVVERHIAYAKSRLVKKITVIVAASGEYIGHSPHPKLEIIPTYTGRFDSILGRFGALLECIRYAYRLVRTEGFDLIVAQDALGLYGYILKFLFRKPLFVSVHGAWLDAQKKYKPFRRWYYTRCMPSILRQCEGIRVVSDTVKQQLIATGLSKKNISVIPTAVKVKKFLRQPRINPLKKTYAGREVVFSVGRLEAEKNYLFLLEVIRRVAAKRPKVLFLIAGDGSERASLEERVREMGIRKYITFLGHIDNDALRSYFAIARAFVLPSVSESLGKVLIEAGAARLPSVAIRNLGTETIIQNKKTGYLIERGSAQEFSESIISLLRARKRADRMGMSAQKHIVENFPYERSIAALPVAWRAACGMLH